MWDAVWEVVAGLDTAEREHPCTSHGARAQQDMGAGAHPGHLMSVCLKESS
jgi:hypothetical protein